MSCGSTSIIYLYGFFVFFLRCGHGLCNNENESKNNIKQKDPKLYNIINQVFLNNNETKMANLGNCVTWPRSCEQYKRRWDTLSVNNSIFEPFRGSSNKTKQDEVSIHIHCGEQKKNCGFNTSNLRIMYKKSALLFYSLRYVALDD